MMTKQTEIEVVLKRLGRHSATIADAYIYHHGMISDSSENARAIDQLSKDRMIWRPDDTGQAHLSNDLTRLLDRALIRSSRLHINVEIGTRITELEDCVNLYRRARSLASLNDVERLSLLIQEQVYDLAENLISATNVFRSKVEDGFSEVTDLELRVSENEKTIDRARKLNDALGLLSVAQLAALAGSDVFLIRLFCYVLPRAVDSCRAELVASLHMLTNMLFTLRQQHHRHKLIEASLKKYNSRPGYTPTSLERCAFIPADENYATVVPIDSAPDIYSLNSFLNLSEFLKGIRIEISTDMLQGASPSVISVDDADAVEVVEISPMIQDFFAFLDDVDDSTFPESAVGFYDVADRTYSLEIWLMSVINGFYSLNEEDKKLYEMALIEEAVPSYNGNYLINDVLIEGLR